MDFLDFPRGWLARLGFKLFSVNDRGQLQSNLWCICKDSLNPTIISCDDQQISFSFSENNITFCIAAIYAATCYIKRRTLWQCLSNLQQQFIHPWCFIGDFNTILGAHEHNGAAIPARNSIDDFQSWSDSNLLMHLPTTGAFFTWTNGRGGSRHTERRLDVRPKISLYSWFKDLLGFRWVRVTKHRVIVRFCCNRVRFVLVHCNCTDFCLVILFLV
ncbi:hypothetical protein P8452_51760 [Trifolium repens]|nr:hypothetical protein P8452_51760 [Trifolium repens]